MIKISYLMRRLPHLTRGQFQTYWSEKHPSAAPAEAFPALGIKRYIQVLTLTLDTDARDLVIGPRTGLEESFDGIAELWVDSIEVLKRDWATEEARGYIQTFFDDEQNFIDWSRSTILVSKENIVMP